MAVNGETYIGEPYEVMIDNHKVTIYVFFPEDMPSGASLNGMVYWPGASGYALNKAEYQQISDYYTSNENVDYVFFSFEKCRNYNGITDEAIRQVIEQICKEKNINIDINCVAGFSAGGDEAVSHVLNILRNNPDAEQQKLVLYDPFSSNGGFGYNLKEDDIRLMRENELTTFLIMPRGRANVYRNSGYAEGTFVRNLAANGIPTVIVDGNFVHGTTTARTIYDGWMDYINGNIELEEIKDDKIGYKISVPVVDADGNVTWKVYNLADLIDAKLHPSNYSADDLRDMNYALDSLDDMRVEVDADALIRRAENLLSYFSSLLSDAPPSSSCGSTSVLIPSEFSALQSARDALSKMCDSAQIEIRKAIHAGNEYIKMEAELLQNTSNLNTIFNENLEDLRIEFVPLEVEIDDPDLKNTKKDVSVSTGGGYPSYSYGSTGGGSSYSSANADNSEDNEKEDNLVSSNDTNSSNQESVTSSVKEESIKVAPSSGSSSVVSGIANRSDSPVHSTVSVSSTVNDDNDQVQEDVISKDTVIDNTITPEVSAEEKPVIIPSIDQNDTTSEYVTPQDTPSLTSYQKNNSNNVIKTIGAVTAAGAAVAAGAYGVKKYKENNEDSDDDSESNDYYDFDKEPSSNDEI